MHITKKLRRLTVCAIMIIGLMVVCGTTAHKDYTMTRYAQAYTSSGEYTATASDIYNLLTDEMILFYEDEIAGERFVTSMKSASLQRLAGKLGISTQKTKALLLLCDFAQRNGDYVNINDLASKKDSEIIRIGKNYINRYKSTLSDAEVEQLKQRFKQRTGK